MMWFRAAALLVLCICLFGEARARGLTSDPVPAVLPPTVGDINECQVCVWGLRFSEDILADPVLLSTAGAWVAEKACPHAPKEDQEQCMGLLPVFFSAAMGYMVAAYHETLPAIVCTPACTSAGAQALLPRVQNLKGPMECAFCEYAVEAVQAALADETEQEAILNSARKACKELPESMRDVCVQYVDEKGPIIIALLENSSPDSVCAMISVCGGASPVSPPAELTEALASVSRLMAQAAFPAKLKSSRLSTEGCEFCKVAVLELREKLEEPQFQQAIVIYAKRVCERFGSSFSEQCAEMVDQYAPLAFSVLIDQLRPLQLCAMINLCPPVPPQIIAIA